MLIDPIFDDLKIFSEKRITAILVKWKYPFFTHLPDFQKPKDACLIGIFAEQLKDKLFDDYEQHFDAIFWFKADYSKFEGVYLDANSISVPEVENVVERILEAIPKEKICLLETEEFMIEPNCQIREKFGIPGPRSNELEYLRDKSVLKKLVKKHEIPSMKATLFDPKKVINLDDEIIRIVAEVGFPMFRKPVGGCGSGGGGKIIDEQALRNFVESSMKNPSSGSFLIEQFISGDDVAEFWVSCVLLEDGRCKPYLNIICKRGMTSADHLRLCHPMPFLGGSLEDTKDEFPDLDKFAISVAAKLKPPSPHIFCVQGFQLKKGTSDYLLTEVGYRINGARGIPVSYYCAGISQETALLMCHLDPNYAVEPDPNRPNFFRRYVWYPTKHGILKSHNQIPENAPIKSKIGYNWLQPVGAKLVDANSFAHFVLFLSADHENKKLAEEDMEWLEYNFRPDIQ